MLIVISQCIQYRGVIGIRGSPDRPEPECFVIQVIVKSKKTELWRTKRIVFEN